MKSPLQAVRGKICSIGIHKNYLYTYSTPQLLIVTIALLALHKTINTTTLGMDKRSAVILFEKLYSRKNEDTEKHSHAGVIGKLYPHGNTEGGAGQGDGVLQGSHRGPLRVAEQQVKV